MPSARGWLGAIGVVLACVACESLPPPDPLLRLMPREIGSGLVDTAIAPVERDVSSVEIAESVGALVARAPVCMPWPTLWLEDNDRRSVFLARFDLMARDWGEDVAAESERRMAEFVELGFLTSRDRSDIGPRAAEFMLTGTGRDYLKGSPYGREHPSFCPPAGRTLLAVSDVEWGRFACGTIRVRFTHIAQAWPDWARTEGSRARIESAWGPLGTVLDGSVSLSRQWFARSNVPAGVRNGSLQSVCYDEARQAIVGDDLDLNAPPS